MKLLRTVSTPLIVPLACALAFFSLASGPAQAGGPNVQVHTNGTLDGLWLCVTSVDDELQFPVQEDDCLFFARGDVSQYRFSVHVSGSWDELTGNGSSQSVGPYADLSDIANEVGKYVWAGSVEDGLLLLDGTVTRTPDPEFVGTSVQFWTELDTGATQVDFKTPGPGGNEFLTLHVIMMGFSGVSTNQ